MTRILGDTLHARRIELHQTLREAAGIMGFSAMYLSEIEAGKKKPSEEILHKLATHYELDYFNLVRLSAESFSPSGQVDDKLKAAVARQLGELSSASLEKLLKYVNELKEEKSQK